MTKSKLMGFFRPHPRFTEDNLYADPQTGELTKMPSMTKQEFRDECDINNVIKAFSTTGMFKHVSARAAAGTYQDLPDSVDFQESLHEVQKAREAFMTLPAKLRGRFFNDPAEFLAFTHNPDNLEELRSLGLATPAPPPIPPVVVTIAPTEGTGGDGGAPPVVGAKAP
ncbi:internal scaffolding protein [Blackfly microvirus SF02]|uniref:Internal scaffolding protein n=1 Tax=Blackfly microvirus SF02 TaxID=2576452 RepID=A0A4P8PJY2_9VIRU|nr:internal scaffolding protein [Blackfly microvirus SF02]